MAQIVKKFIGDNQVGALKARLENGSYLRGRNAADSADINVIKVNASNVLELASLPQVGGVNLALITDVPSGFEFQDSVLDRTVTVPGSPTTGDRYLLDLTIGTPSGAWSGEGDKIAEYNGSGWDFTAPTTGMFVSADDETDGIYYYGGSGWSKKSFENTTASTGLTKVGNDIRLDSSSAGGGLNFSSGVLSVDFNKQSLTLDGTDITNQYKDCSVNYVAGSVDVVISGLVQTEGVDYTLSVEGGVTRITFAGDLGTGGNAALVSGDVLRVKGMVV
jgi:hypothetical protein